MISKPPSTSSNLLIDGQAREVDGDVVQNLAIWVAKTCLMAELTHPESAATPLEFYGWLFETRHRRLTRDLGSPNRRTGMVAASEARRHPLR